MKDRPGTGLQDKLWARWDGTQGVDLGTLALQLAAQQQAHWPRLAEGHRALREARIRELPCHGYLAWLQYNPQRMVSTGARVDAAAVQARPCFLCAAHLPEEQQGILYRDEYLLLCNPAPIFPEHFTLAGLGHLEQRFDEASETLLHLARDLGSSFTVFYNGPRCGASAPDHLHLQACTAGMIPLECQLQEDRYLSRPIRLGQVELRAARGLDRGLLLLEGRRLEPLQEALRHVVRKLPDEETTSHSSNATAVPSEPLMNLLCRHNGVGWRVVLISRRKHRPRVYDLENGNRKMISPAAVDVGGLVVTPREEDFASLAPAELEAIFREVTYDDATMAALLRELAEAHGIG